MNVDDLYENPVYQVFYKDKLGRINTFDLKTLKGCIKKAAKNNYEIISIEKIQRHLFDDSDIKILNKLKKGEWAQ